MTTVAQAGTTVPAAGPEWPADWGQVLDAAIRTWGGEWDTKRVQRLYMARYGRGLFRADARAELSRRARLGLMTLHDRPNHRIYTLTTRTLNSRKDVRP
jgi:hypothetical protein